MMKRIKTKNALQPRKTEIDSIGFLASVNISVVAFSLILLILIEGTKHSAVVAFVPLQNFCATKPMKIRPNTNHKLRNLSEEQVSQSDSSLSSETFDERYKNVLPSWLLHRLNECGWTHPTLIQEKALDKILFDQVDAIIQAETGSGKTLAYLLKALACVDASRSAVQAMIVVPTRELGLQVGRVAKRLAAASATDGKDKIMIMSVLQGSQNRRQRAWAWAEPPHIVIGTPEELCNMVKFGGIKRYNAVKYVVVDEVDACLLNNAGDYTSNLESSTLHELLSKHLSPSYDDGTHSDGQDALTTFSESKQTATSRPLSEPRQTIFASATLPQHRHFVKQCAQNKWTLRQPVHICLRTGEQLMPITLEHAYVVCSSSEKKLIALRRVIKKIFNSSLHSPPKKVLVFAESQRPLEDIANVLASDMDNGIFWKERYTQKDEENCQASFSVLRYEDSLTKRAAAIDSFRVEWNPEKENDIGLSGPTLRVMFSTDLAARGLDIADITHVIHFDLPSNVDTYVHRAGRAGRFGRKGQVLSIISPEQEFVLTRLANKLNVDARCIARQEPNRG